MRTALLISASALFLVTACDTIEGPEWGSSPQSTGCTEAQEGEWRCGGTELHVCQDGIWAVSTDCHEQGLICSTSTGTPVCAPEAPSVQPNASIRSQACALESACTGVPIAECEGKFNEIADCNAEWDAALACGVEHHSCDDGEFVILDVCAEFTATLAECLGDGGELPEEPQPPSESNSWFDLCETSSACEGEDIDCAAQAATVADFFAGCLTELDAHTACLLSNSSCAAGEMIYDVAACAHLEAAFNDCFSSM